MSIGNLTKDKQSELDVSLFFDEVTNVSKTA